MPTTETNYDAAIQLVKDRYDNEFLIAKAHLNNIFKIDSMKKDSAESIRKLMGVFNENGMALSAFGLIPRVLISCVHILSETLDTETAHEWQVGNTDGNLQSIDQLRKFLEHPARALEASDRFTDESRESNRDKRNSKNACQSYQSNSVMRPQCNKTYHIYTCPTFLALSITDRHERVKRLKLCFNCLKQGHGIKTNVQFFLHFQSPIDTG